MECELIYKRLEECL